MNPLAVVIVQFSITTVVGLNITGSITVLFISVVVIVRAGIVMRHYISYNLGKIAKICTQLESGFLYSTPKNIELNISQK